MAKKQAIAHKTNPFMEKFNLTKTRNRRTVVQNNRVIMNQQTGEVDDIAEVCVVKEVDEEQFIKLYTANMKQIFALKPTTLKIFGVVLNELQKVPNQDEIFLDHKAAEKYFTETQQPSISRSGFYLAINEMIEKGFIAQSAKDTKFYFINPNLFFNGDRIRFVKEYRKKKTTTDPRQQSLFSEDVDAALEAGLLEQERGKSNEPA